MIKPTAPENILIRAPRAWPVVVVVVLSLIVLCLIVGCHDDDHVTIITNPDGVPPHCEVDPCLEDGSTARECEVHGYTCTHA